MLRYVTFLWFVFSVISSNFCEKRTYDMRERIKGSVCDVVINSETSKNGTLSSPFYPAPYPPKTTCRYELQGKSEERIQIKFQDFHLFHSGGNTKECENEDSVTVYVQLEERMEKLDTFCGNMLPKSLMSNGPRLKLQFKSVHASRYSRGFKAIYKFTEDFGIRVGKRLETFPCAFEFNSNTSKSGSFYSPNYPGLYPRDTECHYFFSGNKGEKIELRFSYFDVEGVLPCEAVTASDYVEFSNFYGVDRKHPRKCGQLEEFHLESDQNFFRVTFQSNNRLDGTGFNATYEFIHKDVAGSNKSTASAAVSKFKGFQVDHITLLCWILGSLCIH